ncbi:hypothetical protein Tco_0032498 [Tanacetum coccineum]
MSVVCLTEVTTMQYANENKMMLDRFTQHIVDPLALMSNVSHQHHYSQSSTTPPSTYVQPYFDDNTQLDSGLSPTDNLIENLTNTLALLTQSYQSFLPQTNNQLKTSSNTRNQATVQDGRVVVQNVQGRHNRGQGNNARGAGADGYGGAQKRVRNINLDQENGVALDKEQLRFIAGGQDNVVDEDVNEQPINEPLSIVIADPNRKEENLKRELHSIKMQLASTINHNKSMVEEVTSLKKDFKQKENKYLEEFFDMKALKEKVSIGYKNPLCITRAKQVQPALYNGHEIVKTNQVPAIVNNSEETLEIAEITRKK